MSLRKPLRTRRGGGWDEAGWGRLRRPRPAVYPFLSSQGDASVPTPRNSAPAPTDTIHPFPQIPTRVSPVLAGISRRAIDEVLADQKYVA